MLPVLIEHILLRMGASIFSLLCRIRWACTLWARSSAHLLIQVGVGAGAAEATDPLRVGSSAPRWSLGSFGTLLSGSAGAVAGSLVRSASNCFMARSYCRDKAAS